MKEYFAQNQGSDILRKLNLDRLSGGKTCDIQLKCGEEKFHAHKNVLSQVSEYFEKLFYSEINEINYETVELNSVDDKILKTILDFVYSAKIAISTDEVFDILTAANYFLIEPIQEYCCRFILEPLDSSNSVKNWLNIKKCEITNLINGCEKYLKKNFSKINDISSINSMDLSTFKAFIATRPKDEKGEETAFRFTVAWVKHDLEERKHLFPHLFEMIDLKLLSHNFFAHDVALEVLCSNELNIRIKSSSSSIFVTNKNSTIFSMLDIKENLKKNIAMGKERLQPSFAVYKNHLYMVGGLIDGKISDSVMRLDLRCQSKGWDNQPSMKRKRSKPGVAVIGDTMFVSGCNLNDDENGISCSPQENFINLAEKSVTEKLKLNDEESKWVEMKSYKKDPRDLVSFKDMLYAMDYAELTCERYDPATETSTLMPNLPEGCVKLVATEDQLYVIGHTRALLFITTLRLSKYDPESGESHDVSKIENVREFRDACSAHGEIVVSYDKWSGPVCFFAFNFEDDKWRYVTQSEDTSDYWKLVSYTNDLFE